jgi:cyclase
VLKHRIIPCLLLKDGKLTKTIRFGLDDAGNPTHEHVRNIGNYIAAVKVFNARDVDELVFLDISATADDRDPLYPVIADVARECFMPLAVGGGIRTLDQIQRLLNVGADKIVLNSAPFDTPELISQAANRYGAQLVVVSIDVKREDNGELMVYSHNGTKNTGKNVVEWADQAVQLGAGEIFLTSIDHDGKMDGFDTKLIELVAKTARLRVQVPVIASGGAGTPEHFLAAIQSGADAVSAASIFQYTQYTPNDIKAYLAEHGVPVRLQR